jgi:hypothetical protein
MGCDRYDDFGRCDLRQRCEMISDITEDEVLAALERGLGGNLKRF